MIDPTKIPYGQVASMAKNGSPFLLEALGRLYGIGPAERQALGQNGTGVPSWSLIAISLAAGVFIGARAQKSYPHYIPEFISG